MTATVSVLLASVLALSGAPREGSALSTKPAPDDTWTEANRRSHRFATAPPPSAGTAPELPVSEAGERKPLFSDRVRDGWLFALEGVTHAPIDVGVQAGLEMPFGLRVFGGYGWVPEAYIDTLTGIAARATDDARIIEVLDSAHYSGRTARVTLGVRPFRKLGLYLDAGYAHASLEASRALPQIEIPGYGTLRGGYRMRTGLDLWVVEVGYQVQIARRLVLGAGLGATGTLDAKTTIAAVDGAPTDADIAAEASRRVDRAFETYGTVPTLTLRIGFDLI
jgi:hypothetical protein